MIFLFLLCSSALDDHQSVAVKPSRPLLSIQPRTHARVEAKGLTPQRVQPPVKVAMSGQDVLGVEQALDRMKGASWIPVPGRRKNRDLRLCRCKEPASCQRTVSRTKFARF